jgi:hypothetical protein
MKEWFFALQPTMKTGTFECKYYAEITFKYKRLFLKSKIPKIIGTIQIYYGRETVPDYKEEMKEINKGG